MSFGNSFNEDDGINLQETKKFQSDLEGNTAVNVVSSDLLNKLQDILTQLGGSVDTNATVYNEEILLANTEQSFVLPNNTKGFLIRNRSANDLRFSYVSGGTSNDWLTISKRASYEDRNFYQSQLVYFQSTSAGDIVEIVTYT